jgi:hypothetical protein
MRTCRICGDEFDPNSAAKRLAGGRINECHLCAQETTARVVGVASGDGKQASLSIVRPETEADRHAFLAYWHQATGLHRGKSCQMDSTLTTPHFRVQVVSAAQASNHKGRL